MSSFVESFVVRTSLGGIQDSFIIINIPIILLK